MPWEVGTQDAGECRQRMFGIKVQTDVGNQWPLNKMQAWTPKKTTIVAT